MPQVMALLLLALLLVAAALHGGVTPAASAGIHAGVAALAGLQVLRPGSRRPATGALVLAAAWSALALAQVAWSLDRDAALDGAAAVLAAALLFLVTTTLEPAARRRLCLGLAAAAAGLAAFALATAQPGERARLPFGNPNHLAAWLMVPGGLALVAMVSAEVKRRGQRESAFLWFGVTALIGAGLAGTRSLGGGLAVFSALAAWGALRLLGPRCGVWASLGALGLAAVALALLPLAWPELLPAHPGGGESSPGIRWALYGATSRAALEAAPLGTGLGGFAAAFAAQRPEHLRYAARFAHSEPLHAWVELGLPFVALLAVSLGMLGRALRARLEAGTSRFVGGAIVGGFALGAHALVDFPLHIPAVALVGAVGAGVLWPPGRSAPPGLVRAGLGVAALLLLGLTGSQGLAAWAESRADARLAAGDFRGALAVAELGLRARPARAALHARVADAAEHLHRFGGAGEALRLRALAARDRAVTLRPAAARGYVERSATRLAAGDWRGAAEDLERAARRDAAAPAPHLARARVWLAAGDADAALPALRRGLGRFPSAADEAAEALLRVTGRPDLVLSALPDDAGAHRAAAVALARAGFWSASGEAWSAAAEREPDDASSALAAAREFARAGQAARARQVLARALERMPDEPRLRHELAGLRRPTRTLAEAEG